MQVIAHRGASAYAPENTFAAFDMAVDMGIRAFETDIQVTKDGILVLLHDSRVDRTTNGQGAITTLSYEEVAGLDAGSWFSKQFAGERIPTVCDFLDRYGKKIYYALEVKNATVANALLQEVVRRGLLTQVTFTSFAFDACCSIIAAEPTAHVGFLFGGVTQPLIKAMVAAGLRQACPIADLLEPEHVSAIHSSGLTVRTWGVRNESLMCKVVALDVDGTTVDFPDKLVALLATPSE